MKLLSLNLWNINEPLEDRMNVLYNYLKKEQPEIICFQEVSLVDGRPQVENILRDLNYQYVYSKAGTWKKREEGLVIATRFAIEEQHNYYLFVDSEVEDMQRILLNVIFTGEKDAKKFAVFNTHLAFMPESKNTRLRQMEKIIKIIGECQAEYDYCILMGDFNYFDGEKHIDEMLFNGDKLLYSTWENDDDLTFDSENKYVSLELWPNRLLDYIYISKPTHTHSRKCMCKSDGYDVCSDHYGVVWEGLL